MWQFKTFFNIAGCCSGNIPTYCFSKYNGPVSSQPALTISFIREKLNVLIYLFPI